MKKTILVSVGLLLSSITMQAQNIDAIINVKEVERIEKTLSADSMEGRRTFSTGIDKAAAFIAGEFTNTGLQTLQPNTSYWQSFKMIKAKFVNASAILDGAEMNSRNIIAITCKPELMINEKSGYEINTIAKGANFFGEARKYIGLSKNAIVLVDSSFSGSFGRLIQFKSAMVESNNSVIFLLGAQVPASFTITATHTIQDQKLANIVGVLPGKSLPKEYVIFSGHYDHLGINSKNIINNDSIYNGANDDAAGTTAMMMLAKYYKALGNNERTLIFAAFTAEEVGGFGATYFSRQFNPDEVVAMFNIEMIGTESKWGKNSAYITGFDKTNMGAILQKNLEGSSFKFYPDPYTEQNLFYRSDNATLARLGVAAHTISTSKMDSEPNYHKASDQIETLDLDNMNEIIKAIALSAGSIVAGKDTPTRVDTTQLK
jgi:hypothetical protein